MSGSSWLVAGFDGAPSSPGMGGCTFGQVLHGSATTTEAIRRATQRNQVSLRRLAKRHGINPMTVTKSRKRSSAADLPTDPKEPSSTVLLLTKEAIVVAFRKDTLLPLDDCLYALQPTMPHLTRSSLHAACSATGQDCPDRSTIERPPLRSRDHPESIAMCRRDSVLADGRQREVLISRTATPAAAPAELIHISMRNAGPGRYEASPISPSLNQEVSCGSASRAPDALFGEKHYGYRRLPVEHRAAVASQPGLCRW
jgi:hypothetical protein